MVNWVKGLSCMVSQGAAAAGLAAVKTCWWEKPTEKQWKAENSTTDYCHHGISGSASDIGSSSLCASQEVYPVL